VKYITEMEKDKSNFTLYTPSFKIPHDFYHGKNAHSKSLRKIFLEIKVCFTILLMKVKFHTCYSDKHKVTTTAIKRMHSDAC